MTVALALAVYAAALTIANLTVAAFGPSITAVNAFVLIGLDLALRDWLQMRLKPWQMGALIVMTGGLSYALDPAAGRIAVASAFAFTIASVVDWATFSRVRGRWLLRANASNVAGAAVDSLLFPTIAFGALLPEIVAAQFVAKVAGGALWSWGLRRLLGAHPSERRASTRGTSHSPGG